MGDDVCILHSGNIQEKNYESNYSSSNYLWIVGLTGLFNLGMTRDLGEGYL